MTGLLVVPAWKSADYWPVLFAKDNHTLDFVQTHFEIRPTLIQNQRACSVLNGKVPYAFMVVAINSE